MRLKSRNLILNALYGSFINYASPANITYYWNFGVFSLFFLIVQIVTGIILAMYYTPHIDLAFDSVEHIMRDVNYGWLLRYIHSNGASFFFIVVYIHIFRFFVYLRCVSVVFLYLVYYFIPYYLFSRFSRIDSAIFSRSFSSRSPKVPFKVGHLSFSQDLKKPGVGLLSKSISQDSEVHLSKTSVVQDIFIGQNDHNFLHKFFGKMEQHPITFSVDANGDKIIGGNFTHSEYIVLKMPSGISRKIQNTFIGTDSSGKKVFLCTKIEVWIDRGVSLNPTSYNSADYLTHGIGIYSGSDLQNLIVNSKNTEIILKINSTGIYDMVFVN